MPVVTGTRVDCLARRAAENLNAMPFVARTKANRFDAALQACRVHRCIGLQKIARHAGCAVSSSAAREETFDAI
jgi:hypothetical protein